MQTCTYFSHLKRKDKGKEKEDSHDPSFSMFIFFLHFGSVKEKEETRKQTHSKACIREANFSGELDSRKKKHKAKFIVQNLHHKQLYLVNIWVSFHLKTDFPVFSN